MRFLSVSTAMVLVMSSLSAKALTIDAAICRDLFALNTTYLADKAKLKVVRPLADRSGGLVQQTGKDLVPGQKVFPNRTPADPVVFEDKKTGEVHVYGTQVDGTGFMFLKYKNKNDLLRGAEPEHVAKDVFLPNGQLARGQEAIWDTNRLSYDVMKQVFPETLLASEYAKHGVEPGSDIYYGGIALQEDGSLGRWTTDNWRRRLYPIAEVDGKLKIMSSPLMNAIPKGATEKDYPGFGLLPTLPGNYIGHAYGPNFKLVKSGDKKFDLYLINEEVTRRIEVEGKPAEVTEIVARKMLSPFRASKYKTVLLSVNGDDGQPHPDSDRGPKLGNTKLIEGFRPTDIEPKGMRITLREIIVDGKRELVKDPSLAKDEWFLMAGSASNFAGDIYDAHLAFRKNNPIGPYKMVKDRQDPRHWKRYLQGIKMKYRLSWAGRPSFTQYMSGHWMEIHGADKDLKPDGSYTGEIPANTAEYHRNIYGVPVEFYINWAGDPDMEVLD